MTTYTYTGISLTYAGPDSTTVVAVDTASLEIVAADSDDSFSYVITEPNAGGLPEVSIIDQNFYSVQVDGVSVLAGQFDIEIGELGWGPGNLTYLMNFWDNSNTVHSFVLGGSALPNISSVAEWQEFETTVTSFGPASGNLFSPGSTIELVGPPGVVITEHDSVIGDAAANVFNAGIGNDTIIGLGGDDALDGGPGSDLLEGGAGNDTLYGGSQYDRLFGGGGADQIWGGLGRDTAYMGNGNDVFNDNAQDDQHGRDMVFGGNGNDTINGGGGHDTFRGNDGADHVNGGTGNDTLYGGDGKDLLIGNFGRDFLVGGVGADTLNGGNGIDTLSGGGGNDRLIGAGGNDRVSGNDGSDTLIGGNGNDRLFGGNGSDVLNGGNGNDTLRGDGRGDTFVFSIGNDQVLDFGPADQIDLRGVASITGFADLQFSHLSGNVNAIIDDGAGNTMTLMGVDAATLTADDFLF